MPVTVFFVIGAVTSPPAGWLLDRYSSRAIIGLGSTLLALGLMAYSATNSLWQLVAVYALLGLALSLCGLVSNMVMLTGWFDSGRGRATGILLMASSLGGALFPLAVGSGIEQLGWRQTVLLTGVGVGSIMLGSVWLLLRDGPARAMASEENGVQGNDTWRKVMIRRGVRRLHSNPAGAPRSVRRSPFRGGTLPSRSLICPLMVAKFP